MMYQKTIPFSKLEDAIEKLMKEGYTVIYIEKWTNEWNVAYWKMGDPYTQQIGNGVYAQVPDLSKSPEEWYEEYRKSMEEQNER